ncbi:MAG: type II toxin-antitoxin system MqsA family antitoxin [Candidatus Heimdallarchaeota archaeon]
MSEKYNVCPICDGRQIKEKRVTKKYEYKGQVQQIPNYLLHHCKTCNESFVNEETIKDTEKEIRDFRREVDGLLTSAEIRRIRERFGYTQVGFGEALGVGKITFNRYENGRVTQNKSTDIMLRALDLLADLFPSALEEFLPGAASRFSGSIKETVELDFAVPRYTYDESDIGNVAVMGF